MIFRKDQNYKRGEIEDHMKLKKEENGELVYVNNFGNLYTFVESEGLLKFISMEKNKIRIASGFQT